MHERRRTEARRAAPVFAALGGEARLGLIQRLTVEGPLPLARLTEGTELTRQAVTKHLRVLEDAGLVTSARSGRETLWQLSPAPLDDARRYLEQIARQWDDALGRLRALVEDE